MVQQSSNLSNLSNRIRRSCFFEATRAAGAKSYTVYNHMWMPAVYASPEEDYQALVERVTLWDTAAERQVEIRGADATRLMSILTPRNISNWKPGQCKYVFMCDETGGVINDPVGVKLAEDHYWLSLADSDMIYWVKGLAIGHGMDVQVCEPDVSPAQVQGPMATELMRDVVGGWIDDLRFFRFCEFDIETEQGLAPTVISRTGWSNERGYEIFLRDGSLGTALWNTFMTAGEKYGIAPCAPNQANRMEAGMLSHGADMDWSNNPFEMGIDKLVDVDQDANFIGKEALKRIKADGVKRKFAAFTVDGDPLESNDRQWEIRSDNRPVGHVTSVAWSPRAGSNLALGYLDVALTEPGTRVTVIAPDGDQRTGTVGSPPFVVTSKRA